MTRAAAAMLGLFVFFSPVARAQDVPTDVEAQIDVEPEKELAPIFRYPMILRVHGGVGFAQRARPQDGISPAYMGGVQLMLPANATQSFGIEIDFIQADARATRRYVAVGLFVENRLFESFLLGIGLMAYAPLEKPRPTPVGISTKLGWVPQYHRIINPFILLRADWIFHDRIVGILSGNFGISLNLLSRRGKRDLQP
ncbi:MAG: hypothetical protein HKN10_04875 [Myxococcales bacterium]|nr:hypothetical protein [Myxococcales bacterium]